VREVKRALESILENTLELLKPDDAQKLLLSKLKGYELLQKPSLIQAPPQVQP